MCVCVYICRFPLITYYYCIGLNSHLKHANMSTTRVYNYVFVSVNIFSEFVVWHTL